MYGLIADVTERKRAEETLRRKEAELNEAQRLAHIGSWYWDAKTDATTGSDELLRIYGFDPATQDMPGFKDQKGRCYPAEDWERVNAAVQKTMQTGVGYQLDVQAIRNGTPIWITTRSEVVRDAGGLIVALRGTVQDITERKQAEEAQESLASFPMLNPNPVIEVDLQGRVHFLNPAAGQWFPDLQQRGTEHPFLTDWESVALALRQEGTASSVREVTVGEKCYQQAMHYVEEIQRVRLYVLDITERKRAETALRESEEFFRLLVENVGDYAIFMLDPQGRVASWNVGAERIKGYRADEIVGRHFSCFYTPEAIESNKPAAELQMAATEGRYEEEGWRVRKDGSRFWASVVITAVRDEAGRLRGFAKVIRDITERKKAEEALRESEKRFRSLAENMSEGLMLFDPQGNLIYQNPASLRIHGFSVQEDGASLSRTCPPPGRAGTTRADPCPSTSGRFSALSWRMFPEPGAAVLPRTRDWSSMPATTAVRSTMTPAS